MLQIAFGQSKYYVDNLSENIRRGVRQKLKNGLWPNMAPLGYMNGTAKTIVVDPPKALLIKKSFELYASGRYSLALLRNTINGLGLMRTSEPNAIRIELPIYSQKPVLLRPHPLWRRDIRGQARTHHIQETF